MNFKTPRETSPPPGQWRWIEWTLRYGLALMTVTVAFGFRQAVISWAGPGLPTYITFYPAVMVTALIGGFGPGLVATALSGAVVACWVVPLIGPFAVTSPVESIGLFIFAAMGLFMSVFAELYRRNRGKVADYNREAALRESQSRMATVFRISPAGIFVTRLSDGLYLDANDAYLRMIGYTAEETIGHTSLELKVWANPSDRDRVIGLIQKQGRADNFEVQFRRKSGETVELLASALYWEQDGEACLLGTLVDISERKKAEEALSKARDELETRVHDRTIELWQSVALVQAGRKRFRDALDRLPAYLVLLSPDHQVLFSNRYFEERFGKVSGQRCYEHLFQRTGPCEDCKAVEVLRTNEPQWREWLGPDGRDYDVHNFPFTDVDGSKLVMKVGIDITDRKRAEAELEKHRSHLEELILERTAQLESANTQFRAEIIERRRAEDALRASRAAALNLMEDAVEARRQTEEASVALRESQADLSRAQAVGNIGSWRLNLRRNELLWSDENHRIFGIPQGTPLTYESFLGTVHPDDRARVEEKWAAGMRGEPCDVEHRILVNGVVKWVSERTELEFDEQGVVIGGFGTSQDITERKGAEETLRRNRDRSELLAKTMGELLQSDDPQPLIETLCRRVMEHLNCQAFFNFLVDEQAGRLRLNAYAGIPEEEAVKLEWLDYGVAVCGCVAAEGCRIIAEHIPTRDDPRTDLVRSFGIKAYACHPLIGPGNKTIGTLSFGTRDRETFDEDALSLMKSVADHAAIAMERVNALRALQRAHDELEQRVAERTEELRRVSRYVRGLIEASLDPLVTISTDGRITDLNRAMELATGRSRSDLAGSDFSAYFTEPYQAQEGYERVLTEGQVTNYPLTIRHESGSTMDVLFNATTYKNDEGEVQGVFAAARDVTERLRIEQALRNSERLLAEAQRIAHLGGWDWNILADTLRWSDEMFRLFGFEPQAFPVNYARFLECVHPDDRDRVMKSVKDALDESHPYDVLYRIVLPGASERMIHAQAEVMFNEAGIPVRMLGTALDITEQVRAEEEARLRQQQLVQADKMVSLGFLVSGVAHEINNPNHSIMTNVAALAGVWESTQPILEGFYKDFGDFVLGGYDYSESRGKIPEMFANTLASSKRIELIVTELRDFARYSPREKMAAVDPNAVLKSAIILVANLIQKSTDRLYVTYGDPVPPVLGNFQRIEQVLINLLQNACRALPSRDRAIYLTTSHTPGSKMIIIEVRDEGVGIPEEDMTHLGDPFFTTRRAMGGTGLGLWVSFNIIHEHGGTLTFHSREGEGTRAVLALPIHQDPDSPRITERTREEEV